MPKKPSPNGFYFFMVQCKEDWTVNGSHMSMKEAADRAGPLWKQLNEDQRQPYKDLANKAKHRSKHVKLTNNGNQVYLVQQLEKEREEFRFNMIEEIEGTIRDAGDVVDNHHFYLIHINVFCFVNASQRYYPAEIAVARFNLKDGVAAPTEVYHSFCEPGTLPLGYAFVAHKTITESHQIKYPDEKPSNMRSVLKNVLDFIKFDLKDTSFLPPVYTFGKNVSTCTQVMNSLYSDFGYEENCVRVYSLEHLFYTLRNSNCMLKGIAPYFPSISNAILELEKDVYCYAKNISCNYHENSDVPNHCSRSIVIRWAYILCDNCCPDWNIPLVQGQHVPLRADIHATKRDQSSVSSLSIRKFRVKNPYPTIAEAKHSDGDCTENLWNSADCYFERSMSTRLSRISVSDWQDPEDTESNYSNQELVFLSNSQESFGAKDTAKTDPSQSSDVSTPASLKQRRPRSLSAAFTPERLQFTSGFSFGSYTTNYTTPATGTSGKED